MLDILQDLYCLVDGCGIHHDFLEPAVQRSVFFNILPIFIKRGCTDDFGPISYEHRKDPELVEKMAYGTMITDKVPQPVVTVSDEDVKIMNEKAMLSKLKGLQ